MREQARTLTYKRHRFPPEVISHAVWLYFRFALSYRDVEELLAERGVVLTYETVRQWCRKFGQQYANTLRRRRAAAEDELLRLQGMHRGCFFVIMRATRGARPLRVPPSPGMLQH